MARACSPGCTRTRPRSRCWSISTTYLTVGLQSRTGGSVVAECTKESGPVLIAYLKERCPDIYTGDGEVLSGDEYLQLWAEGQKKTNA